MKKIIMILTIAIVAFANGPQGGQDRQPPEEAIAICKNKDAGTTCQMTTPQGDTLSGICKYTPDEKYFVCMPSGGQKPPKNR